MKITSRTAKPSDPQDRKLVWESIYVPEEPLIKRRYSDGSYEILSMEQVYPDEAEKRESSPTTTPWLSPTAPEGAAGIENWANADKRERPRPNPISEPTEAMTKRAGIGLNVLFKELGSCPIEGLAGKDNALRAVAQALRAASEPPKAEPIQEVRTLTDAVGNLMGIEVTVRPRNVFDAPAQPSDPATVENPGRGNEVKP